MKQFVEKIAFGLLGGIAYCAGCSLWNRVIEPGIVKMTEHFEKKLIKKEVDPVQGLFFFAKITTVIMKKYFYKGV